MSVISEMVEGRVDKVLTQYRESPKLLFVIRSYLTSILNRSFDIHDLPSLMDIDTAEGDQLTMIGKVLGWGRCHCVCDLQIVFGFNCDEDFTQQSLAGFCDEGVTWENCGTNGVGEICINDDETYRKFLKVRCYQMGAFFDIDSLNMCVKILFGEQASVLDSGNGRVVLAPDRELSEHEQALLQLYPRVLPVTLGVSVRFHFFNSNVFGFGEGWGGFCDILSSNEEIETDESNLITETSEPIITGDIRFDALWMCEFDVKPYTC